MLQVAAKSPAFLAYSLEYMKVWFHLPLYKGSEEIPEDGEVIRVMSEDALEFGFIAETVKAISDKFNLTMEFVGGGNGWDMGEDRVVHDLGAFYQQDVKS